MKQNKQFSFGNDWDGVLADEFKKEYYLKLKDFISSEYRTRTIYPDKYEIFSAFKETPYSAASVVILGQDPYHEPGQAHGMCFSVKPGTPIPPSLVNIYKEQAQDVGISIPNTGYLLPWAGQGVLLLNAVLTVRAHQATSHAGKGWENFTDRAIELLSDREDPLVFMLWGRYARNKKTLIDGSRHLILEAAHPSPLSAYNGFFGCRHFSKANDFLAANGKTPIDWQL
ncbi:MAG TPA: uracil-DNA glycosylase [Bacteroidales bacterium]|nr:uracil-DNA glycosylase [Bacillota bacterium]HQC35482.1 uracil-DNA glycosylase [Bacillota bacterium]HQP79051.1 uracil-DNA glycosylase [Bacteroidales bacterium]